jgi:hypothetical protein
MEERIAEEKRILVLDLDLHDTLARWWNSHKDLIKEWDDVKQAI